MRGFDNKWKNFPDYILGITQEIWEGRGIGPRLEDYYHRNVIVRMPGGISQGEPATRAATMATLHEFPDRPIYVLANVILSLAALMLGLALGRSLA